MTDPLDRLKTAVQDRYTIERELGAGGMATVYLAEDTKLHRKVALKVLRPELAAALGPERFLREIEIAARLHHPHILPLHDSGEAEGFLYYVMPYVEGESLRDRLNREKQLPIDDALQIAREVADALGSAHRHEVIHRDIKPENILLEEGHAVVADFGIARAIDVAGGDRLTETGLSLGTPQYMSPEQAAGGRDLDGRSDLYSLGCVLYEMLGGEPPFTGATVESIVHQHVMIAPTPVTALRPAVPAHVVSVLSRVLSKAPADRFNPAAQFVDALGLQTVSDTNGEAQSPEPVWSGTRSLVVTLALLAIIAAGWFLIGRGDPQSSQSGRGSPDWLIVAEFDGPATDPTLAVAVRELVSATLDESRLLATVPRDQIALGLERAGKSDAVRLDAELARELAVRSALRAVVTGRIDAVGQGYSIVLRVLDADAGHTVSSVTGVAGEESALIEVLPRLARELRERLGERRNEIAAMALHNPVSTPSFEAYRAHSAARELISSGDVVGAMQHLREALIVDPQFGMAWVALATQLNALGYADSAQLAIAEAVRWRDRMSTVEQLFVDAFTAVYVNRDVHAAIRAFERIIDINPRWAGAHNGRAIRLASLGRFEEAVAGYEEADRILPFGLRPLDRSNQTLFLIQLGRLDEARRVLGTLSGVFWLEGAVDIAIAASEWTRAESLGTALLEDPEIHGSNLYFRAGLAIASSQGVRGRVREAHSTLVRLRDEAWSDRRMGEMWGMAQAAVLLASAAEAPAVAPTLGMTDDQTSVALVGNGLLAVASGDTATARLNLQEARRRAGQDTLLLADERALLAASIAVHGGEWRRVVDQLGAVAKQPSHPVQIPAQTLLAQWYVADAYERLGQPDSAVTYFELVTAPTHVEYVSRMSRGLMYSFAHRRLASLYAQLGEPDRARDHWLTFLETFADPDREFEWMVAEARAELEKSARGR